MNDIKVTVCIVTYQHEKYVKKAIKSVLDQNVTFSIEVLIYDDGSTDETACILTQFVRAYPSVVYTHLNAVNTGHATLAVYRMMMHARGKYIAIMDGDDYWLDENKLEKQVQYLEDNPICTATMGQFIMVDELDKCKSNNCGKKCVERDFSISDYEKGELPGQGSSLVFRNFFMKNDDLYNFYYRLHKRIGDQTLYSVLLGKGYIHIFPEVFNAYRKIIKPGGTNHSSIMNSRNSSLERWKYYNDLEYCLKERLGIAIDYRYRRRNEIKLAYKYLINNFTIANSLLLLKISFLESVRTLLMK